MITCAGPEATAVLSNFKQCHATVLRCWRYVLSNASKLQGITPLHLALYADADAARPGNEWYGSPIYDGEHISEPIVVALLAHGANVKAQDNFVRPFLSAYLSAYVRFSSVCSAAFPF